MEKNYLRPTILKVLFMAAVLTSGAGMLSAQQDATSRKVPFFKTLPSASFLTVNAEYLGGYRPDAESTGLIFNHFTLYQFPPIRLLDFASGVVLYHVTCTATWQRLKDCLTPTAATVAEVVATLLFLLLYRLGKDVIHLHCYRAYCASAPAIIVLLSTFVMTSSCPGWLSRLLSIRPVAWLSTVSFEVYLMQFCVYFFVEYLSKQCGLNEHLLPYFAVQMTCLVLAAWITRRYYVKPLARRLSRR